MRLSKPITRSGLSLTFLMFADQLNEFTENIGSKIESRLTALDSKGKVVTMYKQDWALTRSEQRGHKHGQSDRQGPPLGHLPPSHRGLEQPTDFPRAENWNHEKVKISFNQSMVFCLPIFHLSNGMASKGFYSGSKENFLFLFCKHLCLTIQSEQDLRQDLVIILTQIETIIYLLWGRFYRV